ncbi:uncharacterized protein [Lolium perenne]|uniref:uncharacterized protein n=1 Tax=Lolium perenne TaxID=4522 RepID=UPI003A9995AE
MAEHHGSDVHTKPSLIAEANRLVGAILACGGGGSHPKTVKAVIDFLIQFRGGAGVPWVRMYQLFPPWQEQSGGLLNQEWDRDAVLERAKVIFTLINTHGNTIRRTALGGGTWKGTGAETIGNNLVLTKLYYKRDGANRPREEGFTVFEFHLAMDLQPRVAICVLHRTDYRHAIPDLREYIHEHHLCLLLLILQNLPLQVPCVLLGRLLLFCHLRLQCVRDVINISMESMCM